jgi:uncharacterized SAM-binding protein YcdF (DUF218 family)
VLLVFFSNPLIIRKIIQQYETPPVTLAPNERYGAGIVLGGFVSYNFIQGKGNFNKAADRFIQTALLYKQGNIRQVIISGGNGFITKNNFRESVFARDQLVTLGIPSGAIFIDTSSRNTLENAVYSKKLLDSVHLAGPYLLISSAMHLPRARMVFEKAGIHARLYPCDFQYTGEGNNLLEDLLIPSAAALDNWDNLIKELLGRVVYKLQGKG